MAISPTAVWQCRPSGNNANGGVYDGAAYPGGTDYTQQVGPQITWSGPLTTSSATSTTLMEGSGTFTPAMVGNAINLASGTNAVAGFYFIVAFQSPTAVTLDRAPASGGALSGGTGRLGGAHADFWTYSNDGNAAGRKVVPGNVYEIWGSGSDSPTNFDYSYTSYVSAVSGDATNGKIFYNGKNGRPMIGFPGLLFYNATNLRHSNLYLRLNGNSFNGYGYSSGTNAEFVNCTLDQNGYDCSLVVIGGGLLLQCEAINTGGGALGSYAAIVTGGYVTIIESCIVHGVRGPGIQLGGGGDQLINSIISYCKGDGVVITSYQGNMKQVVRGNTLDNNGGNGLVVQQAMFLTMTMIYNNIISNHTVSGKAGISVPGTTAVNDKLKSFVDYNCYFNNTAHVSGLTAGLNSTVGTDPAYVSQSTEDYRIGPALKAKGLGGFVSRLAGKSSPTSYVDPGAVQRQEPTGGGGGIGPTITVVG